MSHYKHRHHDKEEHLGKSEIETVQVSSSLAKSNIVRPVLRGIDQVSVHEFHESWNHYLFLVNSSSMEDKKKKEAINITTSIDEVSLKTIVRYELPELKIQHKNDAGICRNYTMEELTPKIITEWLNARLQEPLTIGEVEKTKQQATKELLSGEYYFT